MFRHADRQTALTSLVAATHFCSFDVVLYTGENEEVLVKERTVN